MSIPSASESPFATGLKPPYWAVIFTNQREGRDAGYAATADRMAELARQQPGFLGMESTRNAEGFGITVSYWRSPEDIAQWRLHAEHSDARRLGREQWYAQFELRVAKVERAYGFERSAG